MHHITVISTLVRVVTVCALSHFKDGLLKYKKMGNIETRCTSLWHREVQQYSTYFFFVGSSHGDCPAPVVTTPVKRAWFYEVLVVDIEVGNQSVGLPCVSYNSDKSIVDSGTSNLLLPPKVSTEFVRLFIT